MGLDEMIAERLHDKYAKATFKDSSVSLWEPRKILESPRPTTSTGRHNPFMLPDESLPAGQPDPWAAGESVVYHPPSLAEQPDACWAACESLVDPAPLPPGSGARLPPGSEPNESGSSLIREAQVFLAQAAQLVEASETAMVAARTEVESLKLELEKVRAQAQSNAEDSETNLAASQEAHAAVVAELEKARAKPAEVPCNGQPYPHKATDFFAQHAQLQDPGTEADNHRQVMAEQEEWSPEGKTREKRRQRTRDRPSNVPNARFRYIPVEFLGPKYTEEQRQLWTAEDLLAEDSCAGQLLSHIIAIIGPPAAMPDIVTDRDGQFVHHERNDRIPEISKGCRKFFLKGFQEIDLEGWKHKMEERAGLKSRKQTWSPASAKKRAPRISDSVWDHCDDSPSVQLSAVANADEGNEVQTRSSSSAPSAAEAVANVVGPTQMSQKDCVDVDAITQAVLPRDIMDASVSRRMVPADISRFHDASDSSQSTRRRPQGPQKPSIPDVPDKRPQSPEPSSAAAALKRTFSRSPSWHAQPSERKSRKQLTAAEVPPPPIPLAPMVMRAKGVDAANEPGAPNALCRGGPRGKQERLALAGYDCEQCRAFYEATGTHPNNCGHGDGATTATDRVWRNGAGSSRHRFTHAPSNTPPGFWDLSFPR